MKNNVFKKGFTLIELMIVIVILGVLMGTILPRLTGAQARARDTGRIADLNTISQALETYFDDNGEYPNVADASSALCLKKVGDEDTDPGATIVDAISSYLKGNQVPTPAPSQVTTVSGVSCTGAYIYIPLRNKGIPNNGYALFTDVETYQRANFITGDDFSNLTTNTLVETVATRSGAATMESLKTADEASAGSTIYVLYN